MVDGEVIAYNVTSFICALFVLAYGADIFIDHTAIVAKRTGIPQGIIALLTAGAEWEELAVVIVSIARGRSSLVLGNIVGSTISNILGAFSLGLLFSRIDDADNLFDTSSKIYSGLLLVLSTFIAGLLAFGHAIRWKIVGAITIVIFASYVVSIAWSISQGRSTAPEGSDCDSSDDDDDDDDDAAPARDHTSLRIDTNDVEQQQQQQGGDVKRESRITDSAAVAGGSRNEGTMLPLRTADSDVITNNALVEDDSASHEAATTTTARHRHRHSLTYHVAFLILGILAVTLSAYVLSTSASNLVQSSGISDVAFGVVILALATTVPEKFIAVVSGVRGHIGIMVANTVGSNIFLLSLCIGVLWVSTDADYDQGSVKPGEIGTMFGTAVALNLTIWLAKPRYLRWIGVLMIAAYIAFLVLEFTVIHRSGEDISTA